MIMIIIIIIIIIIMSVSKFQIAEVTPLNLEVFLVFL